MERGLRINITNVPKERWDEIQNKIFKMLIIEEGFNVEMIDIEDGITESFLGYEFEITNK